MIRTVRDARRLVFTIGVVLLVLDAVAITLLLSPVGRGREAREQEYMTVFSQHQQKMREAAPARDIDQKLTEARKQINSFYTDRLPERYADIAQSLGEIASKANVTVSAIRYEPKDTQIPNLSRVGITASVTGDYPALMKFINQVERSKTFYVLDSINLAESQPGVIRVEVRLETYLRSAA